MKILYERMLRDFRDCPFSFKSNNPEGVVALRTFAARRGDAGVLAEVDLLFGIKKMAGGSERGTYTSAFDPVTGCIVRDVYTNTPKRAWEYAPVRSPSPETVDVSITDFCPMGCSYCYQDSRVDRGHAPKELVRDIIEGLNTPPYQMAIGGGEPTLHPDFIEILRTVRELGTVPNYTTAGIHLTPGIIEATNTYCGGVAMTYHTFRGLPWFVKRYRALREALDCQVNIHLIAGKGVAEHLNALVEAGIGHLSVVLLAYYPDVGRASMEGLMPVSDYVEALPKAIQRALRLGHQIAFSEGLMPYFLSRPEIGVDTSFASRSEGIVSCYINPEGKMSSSSFHEGFLMLHKEVMEDGKSIGWEWENPTIYTRTTQDMWGLLGGSYNQIAQPPSGSSCQGCKHLLNCVVHSPTHMHSCAYQSHNNREE